MEILEGKYLKKRKKISKFFEWMLVFGLSLIRFLAGWRPRCRFPREARSVLVIRHNQLGDAVAASAFIQALQDLLPGATIDVAAGPANAEVFSWIPGVAHVHCLPVTEWGRLRYYWSLRQRYDLVFQTLLDESYWKRLLGARVAASRGILVARARGSCLEKLAEYPVYLPAGSYVGKLMALLRPLTAMDVAALVQQYPAHVLKLPIENLATAQSKIQAAGLAPDRLIALNISAREAFRALSVEQAAVLARVLCDFGQQPLIWFSPADFSLAKQVQALEPRAVCLRWDSLAESMAALRLVKLYVGPDTGTAHFAAAAGVPCVVLFAQQARPDVWSPYGVFFISVQAGRSQAVSQLPVELISRQIWRLLQGERCTEIIPMQPLRYFPVVSVPEK